MNLGNVSDESWTKEEGRSFMIMQSCDSETWTNCWNLRTRMPNAENRHWIGWHVKVAEPFKIEDGGRIRNKQRLNLMLDMFLSSFKRLKREDMFLLLVSYVTERTEWYNSVWWLSWAQSTDNEVSVERVGKESWLYLTAKSLVQLLTYKLPKRSRSVESSML